MTNATADLAVAQRSDPGLEPQKQENEDYCGYHVVPHGHLLVVCDGMGGHLGGREASTLAVHTIFEEMGRTSLTTPPAEALRAAICKANDRVYAMGGPEGTEGRPGSTCVALLMHPGGTEVAHIGDSRGYLIRGGQLFPITRDHSMVQEMVNAGALSAEAAIGHPDSNKITRALGMKPSADVEVRREPVLQQAGDVFLLVTDGVTDVLADNDLAAIVNTGASAGMDALGDKIIALGNARGGPDNLTVIATQVRTPGLDETAVARRQKVFTTQPGFESDVTDVDAPVATVPIPPPVGAPHTPGQSGQRVPPGESAATRAALAPTQVDVLPHPSPANTQPRGRGATVKLQVPVGGPPAATSGNQAPLPPANDLDDQGTDDGDQPLEDDGPRRGARLWIGLAMMVLGVALAAFSAWSLSDSGDEAPPPLPGAAPAAS